MITLGIQAKKTKKNLYREKTNIKTLKFLSCDKNEKYPEDLHLVKSMDDYNLIYNFQNFENSNLNFNF